jgi:hypothetical protein
MFESSRAVALLAIIALALAAGVYLKLVRVQGFSSFGRGRWLTGRVEGASQLMALALLLGVMAAVLAIAASIVA